MLIALDTKGTIIERILSMADSSDNSISSQDSDNSESSQDSHVSLIEHVCTSCGYSECVPHKKTGDHLCKVCIQQVLESERAPDRTVGATMRLGIFKEIWMLTHTALPSRGCSRVLAAIAEFAALGYLRFSMKEPFDRNGLLYWLGTKGLKVKYINPHTSGCVSCAWSVVQYGSVFNFVEHEFRKGDAGACPRRTNAKDKFSWMQVDLGERRRLIPTRYCLRFGNDDPYFAPRHWNLEGRNPDSSWETLRAHSNDTSLAPHCEMGATASWPIDVSKTGPMQNLGYQIFRVIMSGKDSWGSDILMLKGIEFYGYFRNGLTSKSTTIDNT